MRALVNNKPRWAVHRRVLAVAALTLLPLSACKDILSVDLPTRVPDAALSDPALAPVLVQGAIADFECALANYTTATALLTDELIDATGWIAVTMWDQRRIFPDNTNLGSSNCTTLGYGVYTPLQTARFQAADVAKRLTAFADAHPRTLSGGMKQRCALARAYAAEPRILLMDEPFGALDALTRVRMQDRLLDIWSRERRTVLFITHDVDEAVYLGGRVVVMAANPGRVQEVVDVGLPRPRTEDLRLSPEFAEIRNRIWHAVYHQEGNTT